MLVSLRATRIQRPCAPARRNAHRTGHAARAPACQARRGSKGRSGRRSEAPPVPPVDPNNEEFVVFVSAMQMPQWIPFSVVQGGAQANALVKLMRGNIGKETAKNTLIKNLAVNVYKNYDQIVAQLQGNLPGYHRYKIYKFAIKIRDKENPKNWMDIVPEEMIELPPPDEVGEESGFDTIKKGISGLFNRGK